jgi:hypothetical protein
MILLRLYTSFQFNYAKHLEDKLRDGVKTQRRSQSRFTIDAFSLPLGLAVAADWMARIKFVAAISTTFGSMLSLLDPLHTLANDMPATGSFLSTPPLSNA